MEHHLRISSWVLLVAAVAAIALITIGHAELIAAAITSTGIATTEELVWLMQQGQ